LTTFSDKIVYIFGQNCVHFRTVFFTISIDYCSYILYVSAVDQAASVDDRRTSMAIVEVRIEGSAEAPKPEAPKPEAPKPEAPKPETPKPEAPRTEAPKPEAPKPDILKPEVLKPDTLKLGSSEEDTDQALNDETENFLKEAKRRVSQTARGPFLASPLGANFDHQGRSCPPPGGEFVH
jgi:type IV secretory pathway VirB10-like protein